MIQENSSCRAPDKAEHTSVRHGLLYSICDNPPWNLCIILGFQYFLSILGGAVLLPFALAPKLCITDTLHISELIGTGMFVSGLITLLQVVFGVRLPIIQGGSQTFVVSGFAILALPKWQCPNATHGNILTNNSTSDNEYVDNNTIWMSRMCELQGSIIVAALFQLIIGATGLVSRLVKHVGPIVIASTIAMIALSLFGIVATLCETNWWIAMLTVVLIVIFSQYLTNITIPCCHISKKDDCKMAKIPLFSLFPIILSVLVTWSISAILTATNIFRNDSNHWTYHSRTDIKMDVLQRANWIDIPYPGQWGIPTVSIAGVIGMLVAVISGVIESIGDYYTCAKLCGAPPPPSHAINRGMLIEGIGCVLSGAFGSGTGTTSYSDCVGLMVINKVGSRRVVIFGAVIMLLFGVCNKFASFFASMPVAIIGGVSVAYIGLIFAVGVSNLQHVDLNSPRNLFIFGFSVLFGLTVSEWIKQPSKSAFIKTGNEIVDHILVVILSMGMFMTGIIAFFLDNTIPLPRKYKENVESNGNTLIELNKQEDFHNDVKVKSTDTFDCYKLPFGNSIIKRYNWIKYIPISPTFLSDHEKNVAEEHP